MGKLVALLVAIGLLLIGGTVWWWSDYTEDRRWTRPEGDADEEMRKVVDVPILWLGGRYDSGRDDEEAVDLARFDIGQRPTPRTGNAPTYEIFLGYGRCYHGGDGGCGLPLTIQFDPPCEFFGDPPPIPDVRGVEARNAGDSVILLTRHYMIKIWPPYSEDGSMASALRVANALYGANEVAHDVMPGSDLPRRPEGLCD